MYKLFIKKILAKCLIVASTFTVSTTVLAEAADVTQEIRIKAERQAADLKNKIASYLDNVVITQGTLTIKADLVQIISNSKDDSKVYVAKGKPARFEQVLEDGSPILLEAEEIRYEPSLSIITIEGNAKLSQEGSQVSGSKIIYNTLTEQLEAESSQNDAVTTILQPKIKEDQQ